MLYSERYTNWMHAVGRLYNEHECLLMNFSWNVIWRTDFSNRMLKIISSHILLYECWFYISLQLQYILLNTKNFVGRCSHFILTNLFLANIFFMSFRVIIATTLPLFAQGNRFHHAPWHVPFSNCVSDLWDYRVYLRLMWRVLYFFLF